MSCWRNISHELIDILAAREGRLNRRNIFVKALSTQCFAIVQMDFRSTIPARTPRREPVRQPKNDRGPKEERAKGTERTQSPHKRDKCVLSCIRDKIRLSLLKDMKTYPVKTPQQLGALLQGCRKTRQLTQAQVGARVGLPQKEISKLEMNPASTSLARVFKVLAALELEIMVRERGATEKSSEW